MANPFRWIQRVAVIALLFIYFPVFSYKYLNYDDGSFIGLFDGRPFSFTQIFGSFYAFDYIPLFILSLWVEFKLVGEMLSSVSHAINLFLHLSNVMILALLLRRLLFPQWWLLFFTLVVFAVHPLNVESVAWVTERKGLLAFFFSNIAMFVYSLRLGESDLLKGRGLVLSFVSILFFLLALLSKPVALVVPALFLIMDWMTWRKDRVRNWWFEKIPLFLISGLFGYFHMKARHSDLILEGGFFNLADLASRMPKALVFYVSKFFFPISLSPFYSNGASYIGPLDMIIWALFAAVVVYALIKMKAQNRLIVGGLLWFVVTLIPQMKIVPYGLPFLFADRYFYFAGVGIIITTAVILEAFLSKFKIPAPKVFITFAIVSWFMVISGEQVKVWENSGTLWARVVEIEPKNALAWNNLGLYQLDNRDNEQAKKSFHESTQADPRYDKPWINLAYVHLEVGDFKSAHDALTRALQINPNNQEVAQALKKVGDEMSKTR